MSGWGLCVCVCKVTEVGEKEARRIKILLGVNKHILSTDCVPCLAPGPTSSVLPLSEWNQHRPFHRSQKPSTFLAISAPFVPNLSSHSINSMPLTSVCSPSAPLPLSHASSCRLSLDSGPLCHQPPLPLLLHPQLLESGTGLLKHIGSCHLPQQTPSSGLPVELAVKSECLAKLGGPSYLLSSPAFPGLLPPHLEYGVSKVLFKLIS